MKSEQDYIGQVENGLRSEYFIKGDKLQSITDMMQENNIPGISIAVVNNFEVAWLKCYGIADTETEQEINTNTIFQAASVSKPVTALAVMKLVQEGRLDLDENINSYLKTWKLPENEYTVENKVTLRNLLSHTAGVTIGGFPGYRFDAELPNLVQVLKGEYPANTGEIAVDMKPDTAFRYSGGGYTILQQVLIDQLQKPFEEIMHELVLQPLGMTNSFFRCSSLKEEQSVNAAAGHKTDGAQIVGKRHIYPEMAAAGLWTTPEDLAKFAIEIQKSLKGESNKVLSKEFAEIMTTPALIGKYNIGLANEKVYKEQLLEHGGSNEGYKCGIKFHKEKGYGVILMTNGDNGYKLKLPLLRSVAAAYGWVDILHPDYKNSDISEDEIKLFCGNYRMEPDITMKVFQEGNKLFYKTIFDAPKQLDYVGNNIMIDRDRTLKIEIKENSNNLYINGVEKIRLKDGEKLISDYIEEDDLKEAARIYKELMEKDNSLKHSLENDLNYSGYRCIGNNNTKNAVAFLKVNTILFPESANAWDSLGEIHFLSNQYEQCIEAMKKSLEYNPNSQNAVTFIKDASEHLGQ